MVRPDPVFGMLFFATRIWVLQEGFFFREPEADDPNNRNSDNE